MNAPIVLRSTHDMTLGNAQRVAFNHAPVEISTEALDRISAGRRRFEELVRRKGGYIYGSTTAPGSRAKQTLSEAEAQQQGGTLRSFVPIQSGLATEMLSERCVRLAIFARLSNAMTGSGKLRASTARAVADLLLKPPPVPALGAACSGEVMPLTWLLAPLSDIPLELGEAMALINGSPFATAMACDLSMTTARRLRLAERIFVRSIEAAGCPGTHFDPRLAALWSDPFYEQSLARLTELLKDSEWEQLQYQAPTCWRVLPNVMADAWRALDETIQASDAGLRALKDNPTFCQSPLYAEEDAVLSSGGYHDHGSSKAIDRINSALVDLCVLASRQLVHLLDGRLGLPPLLVGKKDGVGMEYLVWTLTEPLTTAARAASSTNLGISLQDPAGNQSDISSLAFIAYQKHREITRAFDACFASLAIAATVALDIRTTATHSRESPFLQEIRNLVRTSQRIIDTVGQPLRQTAESIRIHADEMTTPRFADSLVADDATSLACYRGDPGEPTHSDMHLTRRSGRQPYEI